MSLSLHRIFDLSIRFSRYDAQEIECVRWKLASISTYSIDCIACLHATEKLCFEVHRTCTMGSSGLEPPTSRLSGVRSNLLSYEPRLEVLNYSEKSLSGDGEIRTLDPLLARQVLSQLSYAPI